MLTASESGRCRVGRPKLKTGPYRTITVAPSIPNFGNLSAVLAATMSVYAVRATMNSWRPMV